MRIATIIQKQNVWPAAGMGVVVVILLGLFWNTQLPAPELLDARGEVDSISVTEKRGHLSRILFHVRETDRRYVYADPLPRLDAVRAQLRRGVQVQVKHDTNGNVWALALQGETIVTADEAMTSRKEGGYKYLWLAVALLGLSIYLLFYGRGLRKE